MAVQIITDSASDITSQQAKELGLIHLPYKVLFDAEEYEDTVTLSHREFYEKLIESDVMPTTSQISPYIFEKEFQKITDAGDTAVVILLSGKLSGTYHGAVAAAEKFKDSIFVIDSENACIGERILVLRALELRNKGMSAKDIYNIINKEKKEVCLLALLDTLEYLKRGGRISSATAIAGSLLSIKPVIAIEDGEVVMVGKARGSRHGNNLLRELSEKKGGIDFSRPVCLAYSGLDDAMLNKYIEDNKDLWEGKIDSLPIATVGCVIGTHAGPGAVAVAFFKKSEG